MHVVGGMANCDFVAPLVRNALAKFGRVRYNKSTDPQQAIAKGLSQAPMRVVQYLEEMHARLGQEVETCLLEAENAFVSDDTRNCLQEAIDRAVDEAWPQVSYREILASAACFKLKESTSVKRLAEVISSTLQEEIKHITQQVSDSFVRNLTSAVQRAIEDYTNKMVEIQLPAAIANNPTDTVVLGEIKRNLRNGMLAACAAIVAFIAGQMIVVTQQVMVFLIIPMTVTVINPVFLTITIAAALAALIVGGPSVFNVKNRLKKRIGKALLYSDGEDTDKNIVLMIWHGAKSGQQPGLKRALQSVLDQVWSSAQSNQCEAGLRERLISMVIKRYK